MYYASTGAEANAIISKIAKDNDVKLITKTKTLTSKEIGLNKVLEAQGCGRVEGDLGEWILQLRDEGPWSPGAARHAPFPPSGCPHLLRRHQPQAGRRHRQTGYPLCNI